MNKISHIALFAAAVIAAMPAYSQQELHESLYVEGEYIPDVIRQDKIYTFPTKVSFPLEKSKLPYSETGVRTSYRPFISAMPTLGWQTTREISDKRGYLDLAAGSYLNAVASAGYRFIDTDKTTFGAKLQYNSTSLFHPRLGFHDTDLKRKKYDGLLGFYGSHKFDNYGLFDASLYYRAAYFNYYGLGSSELVNNWDKAPTQTLQNVNAHLGWTGTSVRNLDYRVGVNVNYFGYRSVYSELLYPSRYASGSRETDLAVNLGAEYKFAKESRVGLDIDADMLFYGESKTKSGYEDQLFDVDNYANISFSPYYRYVADKLDIKAGVKLDVTADAGPSDDRYGSLHISPVLRVSWGDNVYGFYLDVKGGNELYTLASQSQYDYYQLPAQASTTPMFSPVDATIGFNIRPFAGFSAGVHAAYAIKKNMRMGGWYMAMLNGEGAIFNQPGRNLELYADMLSAGQIDVKGISLGIDAKYEFLKICEVGGSLAYQPQSGETGYFNGYDRPRWVLDSHFSVKPIEALNLSLSYQYRGVRNIYSWSDNTETGRDIVATRLPDLYMLNIGGDYRITKSFTVFAQANNLLSCRRSVLPMLPCEGFNFLVGFGVLF
jgi:hypothetical protein